MPIQHCNRSCKRQGGCWRCSGRSASESGERLFPAFYLDQDQAGEPYCLLTRDQGRELVRMGLGKFICNVKAFRFFAKAPPKRAAESRFIPSESTDSSASISLSEMNANVGITEDEPDTPAPRHIVQRARQKIRAIRDREGFDKAAPLAFGSRPGLFYTSAYGRS